MPLLNGDVIETTQDDIGDGTTNHAFTAADDTKLGGIASGATANQSDATTNAAIADVVSDTADALAALNASFGAALTALNDSVGVALLAYTTLTGAETLTNKRITKRVFSTADTATLTIDADSYDGAKVTALAQAMTIAAPTGTATAMQGLIIRILDNGTARALTWNAAFRPIGVTLPTTTVISKTVYVGCIRNTDSSTWDVLAVAAQA